MSEPNKSLTQQSCDHFKTGNFEGLLSLLQEDVTWSLAKMGGLGTFAGCANVGEFFPGVGF